MSSNVADTVCQDCGNHSGIITEQLEGHTMCQACKDIDLFQRPPNDGDCPICFLTIPSLYKGRKYKSCCGKIICNGCIHAVDKMKGETKCPFCRIPTHNSDEELFERIKKRAEVDDANAIHSLGSFYNNGAHGFPQDRTKALELWHRAAELGCASANNSIGNSYSEGRGVEMDMTKAKHYWELAAIGGNAMARHNLGIFERNEGNTNRALKHLMIAVGCGNNDSLKRIRKFYVNGHATKDDYAKALQLYQTYVDGIKSVQRDEAAAYSHIYRYC